MMVYNDVSGGGKKKKADPDCCSLDFTSRAGEYDYGETLE